LLFTEANNFCKGGTACNVIGDIDEDDRPKLIGERLFDGFPGFDFLSNLKVPLMQAVNHFYPAYPAIAQRHVSFLQSLTNILCIHHTAKIQNFLPTSDWCLSDPLDMLKLQITPNLKEQQYND
jgi:hypothetical protein